MGKYNEVLDWVNRADDRENQRQRKKEKEMMNIKKLLERSLVIGFLLVPMTMLTWKSSSRINPITPIL